MLVTNVSPPPSGRPQSSDQVFPLQSSFTSGLIAAFLALANDLAKDKDRQMFENGMLIALCAMGAHLGICTVAGRAAALCHVRATVKKSRVSAADFRKAFIICEHLQYLGTILFITSILYLSFVMFSTRVHPFIFVGISILEIVTISKSCYWKFSALNENMKKFLWKAKIRSQSAEDQEKMLG